MEFLHDGRPCKACTSAEDMIRIGQTLKKNKQANEEKKEAEVKKEENTDQRRTDCPVDKDELGRSTWNLLHTMSTYYPDKPTTSQQDNMRNFLETFSKSYPCEPCAKDLREDLKKMPPRLESRKDFSIWMCELHNKVNEKLGKERFDCGRVMERWFHGWKDGSCDE